MARRTSESGLRMAPGAQPGRVLTLIPREVMWLVVGGMAVGIPAALAASRLICRRAGHRGSILYRRSALSDPGCQIRQY